MFTPVIKKNELKSFLKLTWIISTLFILHYGFVKLPFAYVTYIQIAWFLMSCMVLMPLYGKQIISEIPGNRYLHYIVLLMLFPLFYGVVGSINLNQTVIEGVGAGRIFYWLLVLIVMTMFFHRNQISANRIILSLRNLSWICLFLYIFIILFADLTRSRAYDNTELRGERLRFDATFIVYGFMYYYLLALTSRKYLANYILCIPFLAFLMIYLQSRAVLCALILAATIVPIFCFNWMTRLKFLGMATLSIVCVVLYLWVNPGQTLELLFRYLLEFILKGETEDISAGYRAYEASIALQSIADRPLFGIGLINYQSNMIQNIFGRINVADVGIMGIVMEYGYIGAIILMAQFLPIWKLLILYKPQKKVTVDQRICQLLLLMNVYMFFMCVFTGLVAYAPLSVMLFSCLLFMMRTPSMSAK